MKIGILGAGYIGGPLGRLWSEAGHEVMYASRHPEKLADLKELAGENASVGTIEEAAEFGEVIMEAIPFYAIPDLPMELIKGKTVLSASNYYPSRDGIIDLGGKTQAEWIADQLEDVKLVRAFNMMRAGEIEALANGDGRSGLAIFIASDFEESKQIASQLIRDANFEPVDTGKLKDSHVFQSTDAPLYDVRIDSTEAQKKLDNLKQKCC